MPLLSVDIVVSDAGPLIWLGRLGLLSLRPALFAKVQVPQQGLNECLVRLAMAKRSGQPSGIAALAAAGEPSN